MFNDETMAFSSSLGDPTDSLRTTNETQPTATRSRRAAWINRILSPVRRPPTVPDVSASTSVLPGLSPSDSLKSSVGMTGATISRKATPKRLLKALNGRASTALRWRRNGKKAKGKGATGIEGATASTGQGGMRFASEPAHHESGEPSIPRLDSRIRTHLPPSRIVTDAVAEPIDHQRLDNAQNKEQTHTTRTSKGTQTINTSNPTIIGAQQNMELGRVGLQPNKGPSFFLWPQLLSNSQDGEQPVHTKHYFQGAHSIKMYNPVMIDIGGKPGYQQSQVSPIDQQIGSARAK